MLICEVYVLLPLFHNFACFIADEYSTAFDDVWLFVSAVAGPAASSMPNHRLRKILGDWTGTAASCPALGNEALFTTFVLYALAGCVIRDEGLLNLSHCFDAQVSLWPYYASFPFKHFDQLHLSHPLAYFRTEWPWLHRMDNINWAMSHLKYMTNCPWNRVMEKTIVFYCTTQPPTILQKRFLRGVLQILTVIFPGT